MTAYFVELQIFLHVYHKVIDKPGRCCPQCLHILGIEPLVHVTLLAHSVSDPSPVYLSGYPLLPPLSTSLSTPPTNEAKAANSSPSSAPYQPKVRLVAWQ